MCDGVWIVVCGRVGDRGEGGVSGRVLLVVVVVE